MITPSHNPPEDGGFKYNPPNGGPADTEVTRWIQDRANDLLRAGNREVKRIPYEKAIKTPSTRKEDLVLPYVRDLKNVVDMEAIRNARLAVAVDPLGGAALRYWEPINAIYGLDITVVNPIIDPTFSFMLGACQVAQSMFAQIDELEAIHCRVAHEFLGRVRQDDLATVGDAHQPRRLVHRGAVVVAVAQIRRAGVRTHAAESREGLHFCWYWLLRRSNSSLVGPTNGCFC